MKQIGVMFAGVLTPDGYVSHLGDCYDPDGGWHAYLIKGGAGMGKSTLMRRVLEEAVARGERVWKLPCPSDPDSLDGVVLCDRKVCLLDATAPHIVNPEYPVVCETLVDTAAACDRDALRPSFDAIRATQAELSSYYRRASRYLAAISALQNDTYRLAYDACDRARTVRFAAGLADRLIPRKGGAGREWVGFFSALTPKGHVAFTDTAARLCDRVFAVEDEYGAASRLILSTLRGAALDAGYDVITGMCPLAPEDKTEHLLIPELGLGFVTRNRRLDPPATERAIGELIEGTCQSLAQAKAVHDRLEALYAPAMDYALLDRYAEQIRKEIWENRG